MCLICVEYNLGKLTRREAISNYRETLPRLLDSQHVDRELELLIKEEEEETLKVEDDSNDKNAHHEDGRIPKGIDKDRFGF